MASHQRRSRLSRPRGAAPDAAVPSPALTADVIIAIAALLTTLEDFFALRAACRFYRAGLTPCRSTLASQPPLLLLYTNSTSTSDAASYYEALFHLPLRRLLRCRLPWGNPPSHHTLFYAHGFLITAYRNYRELLLLNLFSGEQIRLPVAPAPFSRVVLSRGLLTVLFWPRSRTVQHCRPGYALWCVASIDATQVLMDLLFANGTLYALLGEGCRLAVVHLLENSLELSFLGGESDELSRQPGMTFMLGECGGEVLLISKDGMEYRAFRWVFREGKWVRVTNLGGRTIFLNHNRFAACIGPGCPGFRGDCIYAVGPSSGDLCEYSFIDGIYDVCNVEYPGTPPEYASFRPLVWVFPSLC